MCFLFCSLPQQKEVKKNVGSQDIYIIYIYIYISSAHLCWDCPHSWPSPCRSWQVCWFSVAVEQITTMWQLRKTPLISSQFWRPKSKHGMAGFSQAEIQVLASVLPPGGQSPLPCSFGWLAGFSSSGTLSREKWNPLICLCHDLSGLLLLLPEPCY